MSEILNRYGVLKTEKHIKNEMNLNSVRNQKSDIASKGRNQIDIFAEHNKRVCLVGIFLSIINIDTIYQNFMNLILFDLMQFFFYLQFIDNPVMFHQEKMMVSPNAELEFAQG